MARTFNGSSDFIRCAASPFSANDATPLTIAAWFNPASLHQGWICDISDENAGGPTEYALEIEAGGAVRAFDRGGGGSAAAATSTSYLANVWQHGCAVFTGGSSRTAYLNGGGAASDTTTVTHAAATTATVLGKRTGPDTLFFSGSIAEAAIWNVALTAGEIAVLARGAPSSTIRPGNLVAYLPLRAADRGVLFDEVARKIWTPTGTSPIAFSREPDTFLARQRRVINQQIAATGVADILYAQACF